MAQAQKVDLYFFFFVVAVLIVPIIVVEIGDLKKWLTRSGWLRLKH